MKPCRTHCLGEFSSGIAAWAHFGDGPVAKAAVVHGEAVVMLGDRNDVFRSGFLKEARPCCRIEMLGPKHRNEILVAKFCRRTVGAEVVLVFGGQLFVRGHVGDSWRA